MAVSLKERIKEHYDKCSDYYYSLWGEHIHHGYFTSPNETKEAAQIALIELLLSKASLPNSSRVLDVGCGLGGTSRFLARERSCSVTGVTISGEQVRMARKLSGGDEAAQGFVDIAPSNKTTGQEGSSGKVQFIELDAELLGDYFQGTEVGKEADFDAVWISEALSHFPNKQLFFENAFKMLKTSGGGKLVLTDWFKNEELTEKELDNDIKPIEHGMLLPPLCTQSEYVSYAKNAGFEVYAEPFDISQNVSKTWDISIGLVADPSLWALALSQGRDFIAFLRAFQAMRTGYKNGTFLYAVMVFERKV